jgi:hypothetical protein
MKLLYIGVIVSTLFLTTGCTVKQTDTQATKVAKHTVNAPLYLVIGVGAVGTAAFSLAGAAIAYPVKLTIDEIKSSDESNSTTTIEVE